MVVFYLLLKCSNLSAAICDFPANRKDVMWGSFLCSGWWLCWVWGISQNLIWLGFPFLLYEKSLLHPIDQLQNLIRRVDDRMSTDEEKNVQIGSHFTQQAPMTCQNWLIGIGQIADPVCHQHSCFWEKIVLNLGSLGYGLQMREKLNQEDSNI